MFWARPSRDDFHSKLENISFLSRVMFISKSFFASRAFVRFGAKRSRAGAFGFDDVLELFLKTPLGHRASFSELRLRTGVYFENYFSFSKQSRCTCYLPDRYGDPQVAQSIFGDGTSKLRTKTSLPGVGEIERRRTRDRRRDWCESLAMIHGPKDKKKKKYRSQRVIARSLNHSSSTKPASFEESVSKTRYRYRFALRCFHVRGCTAAGRSGCSAGTAKKSSHP